MCRQKGLLIPDDLSLIGFDNRDLTQHLAVPLTTVAQYPERIGINAVRLLIDDIKQEDNDLIQQIYCPVELIVRDSCCEFKPESVDNKK